jgi:hypothetical protein
MILYHRTDASNDILTQGFRDSSGDYGIGAVTSGVWLSDVPLDSNEGAKGEALLAVEFPDDVDLCDFEWIEDGKPYREWQVPASLINSRATARLIEEG